MVVIREFSDDNNANKETTFDVTRFTSFLEKDNSFLSPWSWKPNNTSKNDTNSSTKEKQYNYFHPESYFNYQNPTYRTPAHRTAKIGSESISTSSGFSFFPNVVVRDQIIDQERRYIARIMNYNPYWQYERLYPQVIWYPVQVAYYNQAPTYEMFPTN